MRSRPFKYLPAQELEKNSTSKKSAKEIQKGNFFCKLIKTRLDLDYPTRQLQLTGKYDTIVYLRKKETDKLKYYLWDVTTGATGATAVAPKFSDALTLS